MRKLTIRAVAAMTAASAMLTVCSCREPVHLRTCHFRPRTPRLRHRAVPPPAFDAMQFRDYGVRPSQRAAADHLSTFAMDVDTGSYTLCRSYLNRGHLPPAQAVRVEEFVNYFPYDYHAPTNPEDAFEIVLDAAPSPFAPGWTLMRVGLRGRAVRPARRKPAVLTFVIDVSGSMAREDRLGLVKRSLGLLVGRLGPGDRIGIAAYGSRGREVLAHTGLRRRRRILSAIEGLYAGGSTNAEEGLVIGYRMARRAFAPEAINRVILCSDGVANVGRTGPEEILRRVRRCAGEGITLTAVGVGMGNYNDVLMEQLADKGSGHYAYVDDLDEARRVFVDELTSTLQVVARDAEVQVDFNPDVVGAYRLMGYENRDVADEAFRDDRADGGEVGAGHRITALYELRLRPARASRVATVSVRYLHPDSRRAREIGRDLTAGDVGRRFRDAPRSLRLAACVAQFAEVLRRSRYGRRTSLAEVARQARRCRALFDGRSDIVELVELVETARSLSLEPDESGDEEDT
ncbi:MAG: vWA domain-containing protein [Planctomycetota bacterium]|jgi:Ca-activated chloride channel family protein